MLNVYKVLAAVVATATVAGCGGGSSSAGSSANLTLSGVAATGKALTNADVSAKCEAGTGTATTDADGVFAITVANGTLPCVLRLSAAGNTVLHSMIGGSGSSAVVNITPLSDMMVARLAGKAPEDFFNAFDASKVNAANVADAQQAVVAALKDVVDLSGMDLLGDKLQAASGSTSGNDFDQKLDTLKTRMTDAGTDLATIVQALADNSDTSKDVAGAIVATWLSPAMQNCPYARSGKYRVITPVLSDPAWQAHVVTLDAPAGTYTYHDGSTGAVTPVNNSSCEFTGSNGQSHFYYSKSGIVVINNQGVAPARISFAFPEQPLTVADLAGSWNEVAFKRASASDSLVLTHGKLVVTADGASTRTDCQQAITEAGCGAPLADGSFALASSGGGFSFVPLSGDTTPRRTFAYRGPNGNMALVMLEPNNNGWTIATRQDAVALPDIGDVFHYWSIPVGTTDISYPTVDTTATVTAVDTVNQTYTRKFSYDNHLDTLAVNSPYTGLLYRAPGTATGDNGSVNLTKFIELPLHGMGVRVYGKPANDNTGFFAIKVDRP